MKLNKSNFNHINEKLRKKRMIIKVENESETQCYRVATEALISWVENKEACQNGREEINNV